MTGFTILTSRRIIFPIDPLIFHLFCPPAFIFPPHHLESHHTYPSSASYELPNKLMSGDIIILRLPSVSYSVLLRLIFPNSFHCVECRHKTAWTAWKNWVQYFELSNRISQRHSRVWQMLWEEDNQKRQTFFSNVMALIFPDSAPSYQQA